MYIAFRPRKEKKNARAREREREGKKEGVLSRDISLGEISRSYSRANLSNYLIVEHLVVEGGWEGERERARHRAMSN